MRITGRLESGHTLTGIVGSNPTLSAITNSPVGFPHPRKPNDARDIHCYESQWLPRIPILQIKIEEPPTLPLSDAEYKRLLAAIETTVTTDTRQKLIG
jgi:hypothetical protein